MGVFDIDPWDAARRHYERQSMLFMARLMRHFGVTQIDLPNYLVNANDTVEIQDMPESNTTFYRIKVEFQIASQSDILERK